MSKALPRHDRGPSRIGDFFRGLGAAVVLLALLVGMPMALARLIGWPLPHAVPSIGELRDALAGPDFAIPDQAIVKTLAVLAWLYWGHFLVCVLVELVAALRGRIAGGVPFGGINQEVASRLVAAVLVLMPGQGALGVAAAALPLHGGLDRPLAVAAPQVPGPDSVSAGGSYAAGGRVGGPAAVDAGSRTGGHVELDRGMRAAELRADAVAGHDLASRRPEAHAREQAARPAHKSYVVQRGDNLWDIAGAHLPRKGAKASGHEQAECDPFRWREIYELNRGRQQPDGRRLLDEDLIQPGWVLLMPGDAIGLPPAPDHSKLPDEEPQRTTPRPTRPGGGTGPGAPGDGDGAVRTPVTPTTTVAPATTTPATTRPAAGTQAPAAGATTGPSRQPGQAGPLLPPLPNQGAQAGQDGDRYDPDIVAPNDRGPATTTTRAGGPAAGVTRPGGRGDTIAPILPGLPPGGVQPGGPNDRGPGAAPPGRTDPPTTSRPAPTTAPAQATQPTRPAAGGPDGGADQRQRPGQAAAPSTRAARGWFASLPWITGGGLLAAGVLVTLMKLRRAQQRRRPTGRRIPPPTRQQAEAELDIRATELPELAAFLDVALRALSAGIARDRVPAPDVIGVVAGTETLQVLLRDAPAGAPAPFGTTLSRRRWLLPLTTPVAELEQLAGDTGSPLPALVTIGIADAGHVLVNLESLGLVGLAGDLGAARALLNAMAIEFATSSWTDFVEIYLVGFGQELAGLERIRVAATLDELLPRLEEQAGEVARALDETGHDSLLAGRVGGVSTDSWIPAVVLCAEPPSEAAQRRLQDLTADPLRSPVVAVAIAVGEDAELAGAGWTFTLPADPEEPMPVAPLNLEVEPLRLDGANYATIVDLLRSSASPDTRPAAPPGPARAASPPHAAGQAATPAAAQADSPAPAWFARPPGTLPDGGGLDDGGTTAESEAEASDAADTPGEAAARGAGAVDEADPVRPAAVEVRVLGRVEVGGVGRIQRGKSEELIVYLALHPEGVDGDRIADALWRGVPPAKATLNTTTTVARNSLGTAEDGSLRLPHARNGIYRLDPSVGLDWARFQALVARAAGKGAAGADDLRLALELVRGRPFEGVRPRTYGWALLDLAAVMESAVVDAADRLAELRLAVGDATGAQWAARCGLKISPYDERLYRRLMLAADLAGNPAGVEAVMEELLKRLDDDSFEPWDGLHDETRKLYDRLVGSRQGSAPPVRRRA